METYKVFIKKKTKRKQILKNVISCLLVQESVSLKYPYNQN